MEILIACSIAFVLSVLISMIFISAICYRLRKQINEEMYCPNCNDDRCVNREIVADELNLWLTSTCENCGGWIAKPLHSDIWSVHAHDGTRYQVFRQAKVSPERVIPDPDKTYLDDK
jgi:hypothetical protein